MESEKWKIRVKIFGRVTKMGKRLELDNFDSHQKKCYRFYDDSIKFIVSIYVPNYSKLAGCWMFRGIRNTDLHQRLPTEVSNRVKRLNDSFNPAVSVSIHKMPHWHSTTDLNRMFSSKTNNIENLFITVCQIDWNSMKAPCMWNEVSRVLLNDLVYYGSNASPLLQLQRVRPVWF